MSKKTKSQNRSAMNRRQFIKAGAGAGAALSASALVRPKLAFGADELNVLTWCDGLDPAFVTPFEEAHGVRVNMKDYEGTGVAMSIIEQSQPGDWDVFVINSNDVPETSKQGIFATLPDDIVNWDDIFEAIHQPSLHRPNGDLIAVPEKFGYEGYAFNKEKVDPADMRTCASLWNPKYKGRLAIYDWYQPFMQMIGLYNGVKPADIDMAALDAIREKLMMVKDIYALVSDIVTVQTALVTGDVDIVGGGAEFVVSNLMLDERPDLDWSLPDEGGMRWMQSVTVLEDSGRKDLAMEFLRYTLGNEGQAALATSECYWAMPASRTAALNVNEKAALRWDDQPGYLANSYYDLLLSPDLDTYCLDIWAEFLQS